MSSIIRATTSSGLQVAPDNSGSLQLQTNGTTTAVTIDTSQNVGIGTTSPNYGGWTKALTVYSTNYSGVEVASNVTTNGNTVGAYDFIATSNSTKKEIAQIYANIVNGGSNPTNFGGSLIFSSKPDGGDVAERMRIDSSGNVGIGTASPGGSAADRQLTLTGSTSSQITTDSGTVTTNFGSTSAIGYIQTTGAYPVTFNTSSAERSRITSNGDFLVGKTGEDDTTAGMRFTGPSGGKYLSLVRDGNLPLYVNRLTNDGALVQFAQANTVEGTISVSGTTVSYGGGHIARWSQLYNETTKVEVYRGTVLESVDAMCEWYRDGQLLPNEQATKTIISTTVASKKIAGVFDIYDEDDEANPYDFFVAQSGDFVIRIAQGVTVQNGDLLESAGDGTAKPQADDICRSSTIAKVTSNYVSVTYEDGSYCVPCILMIG
jgi:hypothetical protein